MKNRAVSGFQPMDRERVRGSVPGSFSILALLLLATPLFAISPDNAPTSDPSPEAELASFVIHPDFEVSLFADGLDMPMGFALGHGGAWVAADSDLLFLKDTEGDDLVWYRDTGTPRTKPLEKKEIASREIIPTLMPPGLTASLSEYQFVDLVAYLASLKGQESPALIRKFFAVVLDLETRL